LSTAIKVLLTLALVVGVALGSFVVIRSSKDDFKGDYVRCTVTEAGVAERRANGIDDPAQGEADTVIVGHTYQSSAGCIPGDTPAD
jgi:hypothetical protein